MECVSNLTAWTRFPTSNQKWFAGFLVTQQAYLFLYILYPLPWSTRSTHLGTLPESGCVSIVPIKHKKILCQPIQLRTDQMLAALIPGIKILITSRYGGRLIQKGQNLQILKSQNLNSIFAVTQQSGTIHSICMWMLLIVKYRLYSMSFSHLSPSEKYLLCM